VPQRATESLVQGGGTIQPTEVAEDRPRASTAATEAPTPSPAAVENARRMWGALADETKATLARILGGEEEAIRAMANQEVDPEDAQ
jgi:hypothetical protein